MWGHAPSERTKVNIRGYGGHDPLTKLIKTYNMLHDSVLGRDKYKGLSFDIDFMIKNVSETNVFIGNVIAIRFINNIAVIIFRDIKKAFII